MAKTFSDWVDWYKAAEHRQWRRRIHALEVIVLIVMVVSVVAGVFMIDCPKPLLSVFLLMALVLLASLVLLLPVVLRNDSISRYVRSATLLGLLGGVGALAGFGLLMMTAATCAT